MHSALNALALFAPSRKVRLCCQLILPGLIIYLAPQMVANYGGSRPMMFMDARLLLTPLLCRAQSIGEAFISLVVKCDVFSHMGAAPYQVKPLQANTPPSPATSHLNHWCGSALE